MAKQKDLSGVDLSRSEVERLIDEWIFSERDRLGTCEDYGIPLEALQAVQDDRFD